MSPLELISTKPPGERVVELEPDVCGKATRAVHGRTQMTREQRVTRRKDRKPSNKLILLHGQRIQRVPSGLGV